MNRSLKLLFLLFFYSISNIKSQSISYTDSLEAVLKTQKNDTNKVKILNELAWEFSFTDLKKGRNYCNSSIALASKLNYIKGRSSVYNTLANISSDEGKNDEALKYYHLSIKDKEKVHDEKGIATVLNNIGIIYGIMADYDKAIDYYTQALNKRKTLGDKKGIADCYNNLGNVYRAKSLYTSALSNFNEAKEIRLEIGDKIGIASSLNNIATVYGDQADFTSALKYYYESAQLLEKEKDKNSLARVYNNIGIQNAKLRNYKEAIRYSTLALKLSEEIGNKNYSVNSYDNLGIVYLDLKNYNEAKRNFEKGMVLANQANNKEMQCQFLMGLGMCFENKNELNDAEINYKKAIEIAKETGEIKGSIKYSTILAELFIKLNRNKEAEDLLIYSIATSKKNGLRNELKRAYKIYANYYQSNLNQPAQAIYYYKLYSNLNDSLFSEDVAQKFAEQQTQFETEKKENEIKVLKQKEEITKLQLKDQELLLEKRNYMLMGGAAIILFICLTGYFYFSRQKIIAIQKQDQLVREAEENERTRMAKDIHDDLGSGLSKIKILSEIITKNAEQNPEIKSGIKSISETAVSLVDNMRDLIWALNPENTSLDSLVARIREYSSDYLADFPIEITFDVDENIPDRKITKEAHRNIFFILKETLQNIVKHSEATIVTIKIAAINSDFKLEVMDNGKGFKEKTADNGNGLRNMKERAKLIKATLEIIPQTNSGIKLNLIVPFKNIEKS